MTHLTLTGYHAGLILCGADRDPANKHIHAAYVDFEAPYASEICPDCKRVWLEPEEPKSDPKSI